MPNFRIIKNLSEITLSNKWITSTKFNSKERLVDPNGKEVSSDYNGCRYRIIEKKERAFSTPERIGRGLLGTLAVVCTLFTGLFFKSVHNLFIKQKENIRFAILEPTSQTNINSTKEKIEQASQLPSFKKTEIKAENNRHVTIPLAGDPQSCFGSPASSAASVVDRAAALAAPISILVPKLPATDFAGILIPSEVKKALDQLFEGSPYAIDNLPIYPKQHDTIERKEMKAPVMKGITDGLPFIAIKVDCNLRDEDIEKNVNIEIYKAYYKTHGLLKDILVIYQYQSNGPLFWGGKGEFVWDQLDRGRLMRPSFFTRNFTCPEDGTGPTNSQKNNFKLVQTLLQRGQSEDTRGLIWRIST
jgi:hypothetical protein